jgi:hypothetical protein
VTEAGGVGGGSDHSRGACICGEAGLIALAEEVWTEIIGQAAGANPTQAAQVLRPVRGP